MSVWLSEAYIPTWNNRETPNHILCKLLKGVRNPFVILVNPNLFSSELSHELTNNYLSYLSTLFPFLVRKLDWSLFLISNLKRLNNFLFLTKRFQPISYFRMQSYLFQTNQISLKCLWRRVMLGLFLIKVDVSQAYFHLPVAKEHRRFSWLRYNDRLFTDDNVYLSLIFITNPRYKVY